MTHDENPALSDLFGASRRRRAQRVDPKGYRIVSVRLREAEFEVLSEQAGSFGLSNNMALRIAARRIGGFLETDPKTRAVLEEIVEQIGLISQHLAKLQAAYRASGKVDMQAFAAQRIAFGEQFARLDSQLGTILNISRRRVDGRVILKEAISK
ncbi:DNA mobilization endonuclease VirD1/MobC family subunit [Rhizobium binae]|uniref:DNA mobilization endonuclease VirD1/MobC family subunit n=1 Tax=Rhizobium binae TaxID=1138190 RepID=UPI001C84080E|nr:DNA mobilization endonuclease VirD1/MobC family subunit [Rhizobium binae]MBX4967710.1 DNA mobilization endonuclease VirD1/MobC family subunit [Rhizobium binae]